MPVTTENRVSAEQRTRIRQERSRIAQELAHCEENFAVAKAELERAADLALDPELYVAAHRDYMRMQIKLTKKQAELDKHRKTFLSDEEISRRDKEDADAKEAAAREEARLAIARPLQQDLFEALDHLVAADRLLTRIQKMYSSGQRIPLHGDSRDVVFSALSNYCRPNPNYGWWDELGGAAKMREIIGKAV